MINKKVYLIIGISFFSSFLVYADMQLLNGTREEIAQFDRPFYISAQKVRSYLESREMDCPEEVVRSELSVAVKLDDVGALKPSLSARDKIALRLYFALECMIYPSPYSSLHASHSVNSGLIISGVHFGRAGAADPNGHKTNEEVIAEAHADPETGKAFTHKNSLGLFAIDQSREMDAKSEFKQYFDQFKALNENDPHYAERHSALVTGVEKVIEEEFGPEILLFSRLNLPLSELLINKESEGVELAPIRIELPKAQTKQ